MAKSVERTFKSSDKILGRYRVNPKSTLTLKFQKETTHMLIKPLLIISRPTGFLPLCNIVSSEPKKLSFRLISWRTTHTALFGIYFFSLAILVTNHNNKRFPVPLSHATAAVLFANAAFALFNSVMIARRWKNFIIRLSNMENDFLIKYSRPVNVSRRIHFLASIIFLFGVVEHNMELGYYVFKDGLNGAVHLLRGECNFFMNDCSIYGSIVFWIINWIPWFIWIFVDLFIMIVSLIFTSKFRQMSHNFKNKLKNENYQADGLLKSLDELFKYFNQVRQDFNRLCRSIEELNEILGYLIVLSYACNLSFLLIQIFNCLRPFSSYMEIFRFFFGFGFVIVRIILVTMIASSINEKSLYFARIIFNVPDELWNLEIQRLLTRIQLTAPALTGAKFFKITRGLILNDYSVNMANKNKIEVVKGLYEEMQANFSNGNNLHSDIKYVIRVSQLFGMFPLSNILDDKYSAVRFKWLSPWTVYAIFCTVGTFGLSIMTFIRLCAIDFKLHLLDSFLFCFNALVVQLVFLQLARNWPKLLYDFCRAESLLRNSTYQRNLKLKFIFILTLTTSAIMLEHSLAIANTYMNIDPDAASKLNRTIVEQYFREEFPFMFDFTEYSLTLSIFTFFINNCNVFSWSFIDAFIMIMSYALAYRFKQINTNLKNGIKKRYESTIFWTKIREDYTAMAILCQKVNKRLANVVVVSFGANMYFIVTQLYKGLVTRQTIVDQCYFMYSFGVLLFRTVFVILFGSMVHSNSKKPLSYLVSLRSEAFNVETRRFILQVYTQDTSLSGGQFFEVTRTLLFTMAASVITYELFMVQAGISIYI